MSKPFQIYVVDDEPINLEIIKETIADLGQIHLFETPNDCLLATKNALPDMFILDVKMPGMDGYELCQKIKTEYGAKDVPVTFLSAQNDIESRIRGFDVGGEDFIVKPFQPEELRHKVQVAQQIQEDRLKLRELAGDAQKTAFSAMTSMGELGVVLDFLRHSFSCPAPAELAKLALDSIQHYGLDGAVQIRLSNQDISYSREGTNLPLEVSVLNHVRDQGRIFELGNRGVYNYGRFTLLIKNMPRQDVERCGRLRDHLALLAEGADARCQSLEGELHKQAVLDCVHQALNDLTQTVDTIQQQHHASQTNSYVIMSSMETHLERALLGMGLHDGQENSLFEIIRPHFDSLREGLNGNLAVTGQLETLASRLKTLAA